MLDKETISTKFEIINSELGDVLEFEKVILQYIDNE